MSPQMVELHDVDVPAFLKVLDSCEGEVYLMTRDGDRLNYILPVKPEEFWGRIDMLIGGEGTPWASN